MLTHDVTAIPFVGRERELEWLERTFAEGVRLSTIVGPPGVGKSTLARRFLAVLSAESDAEVQPWFCDLTQCHGLLPLCRQIATHFDLPVELPDDEVSAVDTVGRMLDEHGPVLIVLDNVEQLVQTAASALMRWAELAPWSRFVVTSREVLRVRGEEILDLGPLALPEVGQELMQSEAGRLWISCVERVCPSYAPDEQETRTVTELLHALDGLPLAIELAAMRMKVSSARSVLKRLEDRFAVLAGGDRSTPDRHRTLQAAIDGSWDQLNEVEQRTLARCAVFRGGFTVEAAEAVVALSDPSAPSALDVLQSLREKSLLRSVHEPGDHGREPRLSFYLSIRDYAERKLRELGLEAATLGRHAGYFGTLGRSCVRWDNPAGPEWLSQLVPEQDNVAAIIDRQLGGRLSDPHPVADVLVAGFPLQWALGEQSGYTAAVDQLLELDALERSVRVELLLIRGWMSFARGQNAAAARFLAEARALARGCGDVALENSVLRQLGHILLEEFRLDEARAVIQEALAQADSHDNAHLLRESTLKYLFFLATAFRSAETLVEAKEMETEAERAHDILMATNHRRIHALGDSMLGSVRLSMGDTDRAAFLLRRAIERYAGERAFLPHALGVLTMIEYDAGNVAEARHIAERSLRAFGAQWGSFRDQVDGFVGIMDMDAGASSARVRLERVARAFERKGNMRWHAYFTACLACAEAAAGDLERARTLLSGVRDLPDAQDVEMRAAVAAAEAQVEARIAERADREQPGSGAAHRDRARALIAELELRSALSDRVRVLVRGAERVVERRLLPEGIPDATRGGADLAVGEGGMWFRLRDRDQVDLKPRAVARRLFNALIERRLDRPGRGTTVDELARAAWPSTQLERSVAANRIYVHMVTLRKLGLKDVLHHHEEGGYFLDPRLSLSVE